MNRSHNPFPDIDDLVDEHTERRVIAACLLDPQTCAVMRSLVSAEDFWAKRYEYIMQAIEDIESEGKTPDVALIEDRLKNGYPDDRFNFVGGLTALLAMQKEAKEEPEHYHEAYAQVVKRLSIRRKLLAVRDQYTKLAHRGELPIDVIRDESYIALNDVFSSLDIASPKTLAEHASDYIDLLDAADQGKLPNRLPTGFAELDNPSLLGGFKRGDLVMVGGESSMGKTAFGVSMVDHMIQSGKKGVFISMEMAEPEMVQRFVAARIGLPLNKLKPWTPADRAQMLPSWQRQVELTDGERQQVVDYLAGDDLQNVALIHRPSLTPLQVWSLARRFKIEHGHIDFVLVDLITNMTADDKDADSRNRARELMNMATTFKEMASTENLDTTVIALSQVSGTVQGRSDRRPLEGDFRDSKGIGFLADVQMFVYRDSRYNEEADPRDIEILVRKHRSGAIGSRVLQWDALPARVLSRGKLS